MAQPVAGKPVDNPGALSSICSDGIVRAVDILGHLQGVATARTLGRHGITARDLAAAVASEQILRVRRGVYAHPAADPVHVAELAWHGVATCVTAAERLGLPTLERDRRIHLRVASSRSQAGRNVTVPQGIVRHPASTAPGLLSVIEAIDDAAQCVGKSSQLAMLDAALARGLVERHDIAGMQRGEARQRAWLGRHADGRAESPAETLARVALIGARLPFDLQVHIATVGRVDILVARRVIVEVDGRSYHADPVAFANDRRRDRAAAALGFTVLRFTAAEALAGGDVVLAAVLAALRAPSRPLAS